MSPTRVGILLFALSVIAGPLYTVPEYSMVRNLISELAAQNTPRNWLMAAAFVALGTGIAVDGFRRRAPHWLPFMAFGILMALAGLFGHRPLDPEVPYVAWVHTAHSVLATGAGISITAGFIWQAFRRPGPFRRLACALLALVCVALPLLMLWHPSVQGATQRVMYALVFSWLWISYPKETPG